MKIIDLEPEHTDLFCLCLEDWSDEAKEAGPTRREWVDRCQSLGLRAKRAAAELGDDVVFEEIDTSDRRTIAEWGFSDAVLVDGRELQRGPPPSLDKIRAQMSKRVRRLKRRDQR